MWFSKIKSSREAARFALKAWRAPEAAGARKHVLAILGRGCTTEAIQSTEPARSNRTGTASADQQRWTPNWRTRNCAASLAPPTTQLLVDISQTDQMCISESTWKWYVSLT